MARTDEKDLHDLSVVDPPSSAFWHPPAPESDEGHKYDAAIWWDPARHSGYPCINGTRISIEVAAHWCGHDAVESFCQSYDVTRREALCASAAWALYLPSATAADRRQQKAWRSWAEAAWQQMWHSDDESTAKVPDPPRQEKW